MVFVDGRWRVRINLDFGDIREAAELVATITTIIACKQATANV